MTLHDAAQGSMTQEEDINGKLLELKFCCKDIYLHYYFLNPFVLFVHGMATDALTLPPAIQWEKVPPSTTEARGGLSQACDSSGYCEISRHGNDHDKKLFSPFHRQFSRAGLPVGATSHF